MGGTETNTEKLKQIIMVCVSCIVVPLLLWLWHKFLQPLVLRFWGPLPWGNQEAVADNKDSGIEADKETNKGTCPFSSKLNSNGIVANGHSPQVDEETSSSVEHKKSD